MSIALHILSHLMLTENHGGGFYDFLHFKDESRGINRLRNLLTAR